VRVFRGHDRTIRTLQRVVFIVTIKLAESRVDNITWRYVRIVALDDAVGCNNEDDWFVSEWVAQWSRPYVTSREVAGSITDEVKVFYQFT
jgi:hypothetical protein